MRNLLLFSVLLLGSCWAMAQTYPSQTTTGKTGGTGTESVVGCLSGSAGNYMLTAKDGKTYQLMGDTSTLAEHVGHKIKVTGTMSAANAGSASGENPSGAKETKETIEVSSIKHLSKTCESGGGTSKY